MIVSTLNLGVFANPIGFTEKIEYDTNEWITNIENQKDYVPIIFYYETMNYEKFLIYCFDSKEFNPSNFNYEFDYVVIGYDHENNNLLIYEYYFQK